MTHLIDRFKNLFSELADAAPDVARDAIETAPNAHCAFCWMCMVLMCEAGSKQPLAAARRHRSLTWFNKCQTGYETEHISKECNFRVRSDAS